MELIYERPKKKGTVETEIKMRVKDIFDEFEDFTEGCRVLLLLQRHKEGGETNNSKLQKIVTRNRGEFKDALEKLVRARVESNLPLRVYSSLNERDMDKAIRQFKSEQLDADYFHDEQKQNFYLDARNRFIGALMQPQQRATNLFLWDIDDIEGKDLMGEFLKNMPNEHIIKQYRTKNGWHVVTSPFNYTVYPLQSVDFKKDGLLLLDY